MQGGTLQSKSQTFVPEGELPVILRLHIVVERSILDWQQKTSIGKTIFQDEVYNWVPLLIPLICVGNLVSIETKRI